jgi:hypothetical protein
MATISRTGITAGGTISPTHITNIIDALDGTGVGITVVVVLVPSNASIIFVICVGDIVPPAVMPVLLIVAIYVVPFFIYRPILRPFI